MPNNPHDPPNHSHPHQQQWQPQPGNGQPPKKKRKGMFGCLGCLGLTVLILVIGGVASVVGGHSNGDSATVTSPSASQTVDASPAKQDSPKKDDTPQEYKSALKKGQSYAKTMHMSKQGVYNQLTTEVDSFSQEAAQYAIDNMGDTDWNQNAVKKGQEYQKQNMSPEAIRNQLTSSFEGFTPEEADYAVQHLND